MVKKKNPVHIRYDRETLLSVLLLSNVPGLSEDAAKRITDEYERVRSAGGDKACQSKVWHGPGHQSSTYCEARGGRHDISDGRNFTEFPAGAAIHAARLPSGGWAEWTDDDPYDR